VRALGDRFVRTEAVMRGGEREDREGLEEGEGRRGDPAQAAREQGTRLP